METMTNTEDQGPLQEGVLDLGIKNGDADDGQVVFQLSHYAVAVQQYNSMQVEGYTYAEFYVLINRFTGSIEYAHPRLNKVIAQAIASNYELTVTLPRVMSAGTADDAASLLSVFEDLLKAPTSVAN
jgi:hypothetical protein